MASDELVPWLRGTIEADLSRWRAREEAYLASSRRGRHEALFEAREQIARCEAELAILGEYEAARKVMGEARESPEGVGAGLWACVKTLNRAVGLLGQGYRFRDGYRREWRP